MAVLAFVFRLRMFVQLSHRELSQLSPLIVKSIILCVVIKKEDVSSGKWNSVKNPASEPERPSLRVDILDKFEN